MLVKGAADRDLSNQGRFKLPSCTDTAMPETRGKRTDDQGGCTEARPARLFRIPLAVPRQTYRSRCRAKLSISGQSVKEHHHRQQKKSAFISFVTDLLLIVRHLRLAKGPGWLASCGFCVALRCCWLHEQTDAWRGSGGGGEVVRRAAHMVDRGNPRGSKHALALSLALRAADLCLRVLGTPRCLGCRPDRLTALFRRERHTKAISDRRVPASWPSMAARQTPLTCS